MGVVVEKALAGSECGFAPALAQPRSVAWSLFEAFAAAIYINGFHFVHQPFAAGVDMPPASCQCPST